MKKTFTPQPARLAILLVFLTLRLSSAWGQAAPAWQWATTPTAGSSNGNSTAVDAAGNVYVAGSFTGTATFGATTLTSAGSADVFVARLTPSGGYQWAKRAGGADSDIATALAIDASGNIVVAGQFESAPAAFGPNSLTGVAASVDVFVAKLNPAGTWQWAKSAGGSDFDFPTAVTTDPSGNILLTGSFQSLTSAFGATTVSNNGRVSTNDVFVAKLNPAGTWLWAKGAGDSNQDIGYALTADSVGNVYVTGGFNSGAIGFGATSLTNSSSGSYEVFVARLSPAGAWQWATRGGGTNNDVGNGLQVGRGGALYVTGFFQSATASFGTTALTNAGTSDVFVGRLSLAGAWQWAVRAGGAGDDHGNALAVDGTGNLLLAGIFRSPAAAFGPTTLATTGDYDVFVAQLTAAGAWRWATGAGSLTTDNVLGLALSSSGNVVLAGSFTGPTADFGPITLTNPVTNSQPSSFVASLAGPVGLPTDAPGTAFSLAPNPATTTVQLTGAPAGTTACLLDALGRIVRTYPAGSTTLDLHGLAPGLYTVRAGAATRRLVVE